MILFTADFPKKNYEILGMVTGSGVLARNVVSDTISSVKNLVGGELEHYSELLDKSVELATDRMKLKAESMGAEAIIAVRISTVDVITGSVGIVVYGTAVRFV